ncbi:hypothetical protein ACRALDRAFT_1072102 [Sodiomyces alcalophilus JCM 7366]|uniref:uncharacterized protein n=1 Tax=Sodiomyces alcalophilus JCM 7366 TaxID=591952 RepID=UPI0039B3EB29
MSVRRPVYHNSAARHWTYSPDSSDGEVGVESFHTQLPGYSQTRLVSLDSVARELGVKAVYVKDETDRFGLPSFKILGASWGTFRAVVQRLGLCLSTPLQDVKKATSEKGIRLFAATEGNHGRAVARMGSILGAQVSIYVPRALPSTTVELIKSEGADVVQIDDTYDDSVLRSSRDAEAAGGVLVQDTAFSGYEEIPNWIVQGYQTMLKEVDEQLLNSHPDVVISPVGVGSFAQAVVAHYKSPGKNTKVVTVEPDTAACLWKSLSRGSPDVIQTSHTIMNGMEAGTVSSIAWPLLQQGVDASVTVSDYESHRAVQELESSGILAGPCGAATLAALRRLASTPHDRERLNLTRDTTVVLLCTEGRRAYPTPRDVTLEDAVSLTQALVRINSAVPGTAGGTVTGPGETEIAQYIAAWLEHRDIETHWIEPTPGRPSVVGVVRGTGGGKTLMFNGHIDTVTTASYQGDPFSGEIRNGKLYGRGSADMKSGLAASLAALAEAKKDPMAGDVILAAVADEEDLSIGTEQVLAAGWRADAAIVCEPTDETLAHAHRGFAWVQVDIHGVAAHGSRFDLGVDAITRAGYFLVELARYSAALVAGARDDPVLGPPSVHASMVRGGEEPASYPAKCTVVLERRTVVGETAGSVESEVRELLRRAAGEVEGPELEYDVKVTFFRPPFAVSESEPIVQLVRRAHESVSGNVAVVRPVSFWTDCALLAAKGIPAVVYGPKGHGLHSKEWVDVKSVETVSATLVRVMREFCASL